MGISEAAGQVRFGINMRTKTRLIEFRALCRSRPEAARRGKPETSHFLRLHPLLWAAHQRSFIVWRITAKKRMVAKLKVIRLSFNAGSNHRTTAVVHGFGRCAGYYQYHAVR